MTLGRPKKIVNEEEMQKLCALHCTRIEIAGWFNISEDTIERRMEEWGYENFTRFFEEHSAPGKISLRREQYSKAIKGNTTMLIWLGKQYLGQTDKTVSENHFPNTNISLSYIPASQRKALT